MESLLQSAMMMGLSPGLFKMLLELVEVLLPEDGVVTADAAAAAATAASDCDRIASRLRLEAVAPCLPNEPLVLGKVSQ